MTRLSQPSLSAQTIGRSKSVLGSFFYERIESLLIAFWDVDNLITDVDAIITVYLLDFIYSYDITAMYAKEPVFG